jgi:transposase
MNDKDIEIAALKEKNAALEEKCAGLEAVVARLCGELEDLKRRLGLNSGNSGKPPSSDGLAKKPAPKSLREAGKNPSGGRAGSESTTLRQIENPDKIIEHAPEICECCGESLEGQDVIELRKRQEFELPVPKLEVTEHRVLVKKCRCGKENAVKFPAHMKAQAQYGPHLKGMLVYDSVQNLIPEDRLQQRYEDLYGVKIATDTIVKAVKDCAEDLAEERAAALKAVESEKVKHADETGFRIGGKTNWLHVLCSLLFTIYRVSTKRGDVPKKLKGVLVHDHFGPYLKMKGRGKHALCGAHILRELQGVIDHGSAAEAVLARAMRRLLRIVCRFSEALRETKTWRGRAKKAFIGRILDVYRRLAAKAVTFYETLPPLPPPAAAKKSGRKKKRTGHNLFIRLRDFEAAVLRCLDGMTPFTNNRAEQDIRMMKVKRNVSGGFRTFGGAEIFCTVRGFISTVKKHGKNVFRSLLTRSYAA